MTRTLVAMFDDISDARAAISDLVDHGVRRDDISMVASDASGEYGRDLDRTRTERTEGDVDRGKGAGVGAGVGAGIGGLAGLLLSLGALAIPGVGPVVAAGPILATLTGAGIGAAIGGLTGALTGMGVPREEAEIYSEGVRRGSTLVVATVADNDVNRVTDILNNHHPIDIDRRAQEWRSRGWERHDERAEPYTADQVRSEREHYRTIESGKAEVPVVEENIEVGKRGVQGGGVRVRSYVVERPVEEQVRLRDEHVDVERRRVDRPASDADLASFKEETIEATERHEEPVVRKEARVIEEVTLSKDISEHTETVQDTARRTEVDVERTGGERMGAERAVGATGFGAHESEFRSYHSSHMANSGYNYEQFTPVYRYGYDLGNSSYYRDRNWSQVEPDARREWERRNPGTWDQAKDAVRHAWERARGRR